MENSVIKSLLDRFVAREVLLNDPLLLEQAFRAKEHISLEAVFHECDRLMLIKFGLTAK